MNGLVGAKSSAISTGFLVLHALLFIYYCTPSHDASSTVYLLARLHTGSVMGERMRNGRDNCIPRQHEQPSLAVKGEQ
jgi:hypothetical protein